MLDKMGLKGIYPYEECAPGLVTTYGPDYYTKRRASTLENFKDLASGCDGPDMTGLSEIEWWVLGRHYGLITPILDWSLSPYVAAFFAFREFIQETSIVGATTAGGYVSVWELNGAAISENKELSELKLTSNPRLPWLQRARAQNSLYTSLMHPDIYELEGYLASRNACQAIRQILIPDRCFSIAMKDLARMQITARFLFNDLTGAAEEANWKAFRGHIFLGIPS